MAIGKAERQVLEDLLDRINPETTRASFLDPLSPDKTPRAVRASARMYLESWVVPLVEVLLDRADGRITVSEMRYALGMD